MATTLPPSPPPELVQPERPPVAEPPVVEPEGQSPRHASAGVAGGVILIALGAIALFATWLPGGGAWLFLGLGTAFLLARVLTGRSGYAIPAGILLGFGVFVWLTETGTLVGPASGGMFFICLGLGFLASFAIAAEARAAWTVVPGLLLIGFGAIVQATTIGTIYPQFFWLAQYWPLLLVALGAWLLLRDRIPVETRTPVAIVGLGVLIVVGLVIAAAAVVSAGVPYANRTAPVPMPWPMLQVPFGDPPLRDTVTLSTPAEGLSTIELANTSGSTVVRSSSASTVTLQATRHFWTAGSAPDVRLVPNGTTVRVQSAAAPADGTYIDYVVDVPAQLGATVQSASGSVRISDLQGPVSVTTASGSIAGTNLARVTDAHSMSGSIYLTGDFSALARITSVSGSVDLGFTPVAAVHIDAASSSGDVHARGLDLSGWSTAPHALVGDLAHGGPTVSIRTTSGSIQLGTDGRLIDAIRG